MQLEHLFICVYDKLKVAEIVHLLLSICFAAHGDCIVCWTKLCMNVIAGHNKVLECLVVCLNVKVSINLKIVAHLVPIEAEQLTLTRCILSEQAFVGARHWSKIFEVFWSALSMRNHQLTKNIIFLVVKSGESLDEALVVF